jgi:hypothetical protein
MSYESEMKSWQAEVKRHENWLKAAKSSTGTRHQIPSIKMQLAAVKKRKPKRDGSSSSNDSSSGFKFSLNPLMWIWMLIKFILRTIWKNIKPK